MIETSPERSAERIVQFIKYCIVGVLNTLITLGVIYLCKSMLGWNLYVSNALGYVAGLVNSFVCNKQWTFKSDGDYKREAFKFAIGFLLCYGLQLVLVWMLTESPFGDYDFRFFGVVISGYGIATLLGNVVYTLANFVFNRLVTFRHDQEK